MNRIHSPKKVGLGPLNHLLYQKFLEQSIAEYSSRIGQHSDIEESKWTFSDSDNINPHLKYKNGIMTPVKLCLNEFLSGTLVDMSVRVTLDKRRVNRLRNLIRFTL